MPTPEEAEQIRNDRKALLRGAALAGAAGLGAAALLKKTRGGVAGAVPFEPPVPTVKTVGGAKGALANTVRKHGAGAVTGRMAKAAGLKEVRAWDALKPTTTKKLAKASPKDRAKFGKLDARARVARAAPVAPGLVTEKEASMAHRGARQAARQDLLKFRKQKNLSEIETPFSRHFKERDRGDTARDVAVGAGAIASGGAAIHASRKFGKTADTTRGAVARGSSDLHRASQRFTPKEIASAVGAEVSAKTRKTLKSYFPTFIKGGKKISKIMKKNVSFQTPASRLIEFGGREQLKEANTNRYGDPLKAAAGLQRVYSRKDGSGNPIIEDQPLAHAQTIKAALRKGEKIQRAASRGGRLAKDVADTVTGKPRGKDSAGRTKKKEWEKSWFKEGVKKAAVGAGVLGYVGLLRKSPRARATHQRVVKKVTDVANKHVPDLIPRTHFSTPFSVHFAEKAPSDKKSKAKAKEERKTLNAARIRNSLVGATAGSFLGGGLHGGKSGYKGARVGAALGAAYGALSDPKRRAAIEQLQTASFSTPAGRLLNFDEAANTAGWDVRDPRGKSARVFAPGSRRRNRRPKEWHERASNERKLWKAGVAAAGLAGLVGGVAVGRKLPVTPENVIKVKFQKKKMG